MTSVESSLLRYIARLNAAHGASYVFDVDEGKAFYKVWKRPAGMSSGKIVHCFVEKGTGLVYRADSFKKRGRLVGPVDEMGAGLVHTKPG